MTDVAAGVIGFVLLPALCVALERLWPSVPGGSVLRSGFSSDVVWYFVQTFVSRVVAPWVVYLALLVVLPSSQARTDAYFLGFGPVASVPLAYQIPIVFVLADFLSYWQHRLFHRPGAWSIHAIHHSSEELDWLSATRFHPLNEIGAQLIYVTPLLLCGFSPLAFMALAPFTASYAVVLHANVDWSFGPLRYVFASPIFHRWHHTSANEGRDRNFAGFLPVWDLAFGTFLMPQGRAPEGFGIDDPVAEGFLGQLAHPFATSRTAHGVVGPRTMRFLLLGAPAAAILALGAALSGSGAIQLDRPDPALFPITGIDVSHHQADVDWQRVAAEGVAFAYIKSSEGRDFLDTRFEKNWLASAEAGVARGAYHFFTFCSPGKAQAEFFLRTVPPVPDALPPVADVEFVGNCTSYGDLTRVREELGQFIRIVEQAWGVMPILYLTPDALERVIGSEFVGYPVWIRSVFSQPSLNEYREWVLWQFSDDSRIDGIEGPVDRNALRPGLSLRDLRRLAPQRVASQDPPSRRRDRVW